MQFITKLFFAWLLLAGLAGFFMMAIDKRRARKGKYRISEKALFLCAAIGGCFGTTLGMYAFQHKTRHWYFQFGMPVLCILWLALLILLFTKGILS